MEDPKPNRVQKYPKKGQVKYLFRKKLTESDTRSLGFVKESAKYFDGLSESIQNQMNEGLEVRVYTPKVSDNVFIKRSLRLQAGQGFGVQSSYRLQKPGWLGILTANGYDTGDEIDCWCIHNPDANADADADGGEVLSLVIQKEFRMENQNPPLGPGPEPNQIPNVPQKGNRVHLFRKTLTESDFIFLEFVQPAINFLEGLPLNLRRELNDIDGVEVVLFTPNIAGIVHLMRGQSGYITYRLRHKAWYDIAEANRWDAGQQIDCWCSYDPDAHLDQALTLLIQGVPPENNQQQQQPAQQAGQEINQQEAGKELINMSNQNLPPGLEPNQIPNVPQKGNRVHLFRKTLTQSDFLNLEFPQPAIILLEGLPLNPRRELNDGAEVPLFTPNIAGTVRLTRGQSGYITYRLRHKGWCKISGANRWVTGQQIDCWCLYDPDADLHKALTLLIQGVTTVSFSIICNCGSIVCCICVVILLCFRSSYRQVPPENNQQQQQQPAQQADQ
ncbi:hypothetical protein OWV82_008857 [Melia azedarach]|uniref:Uncharacterized protein n=1 Tax=Melia azedarach TaxID=155640 RepID=A0ACC1YBJ2_MELAZ|nr:hypothetical protein OWV82_008857 [Melia azedarach]